MTSQVFASYRRLERQNSYNETISNGFSEQYLNNYRNLTNKQEEKAKKRAELEDQNDCLATFSDMGDIAFNTASLIGGGFCVYTGAAPGAGASLIVSGSVGLSNIAMKYTNGWERLASLWSSDDKEAKSWASTLYTTVRYGTSIISIGTAGIKYLTDPKILSKLSWGEIGTYVAAASQSAFQGLLDYTGSYFKFRTENIKAEEDCFSELRAKELFLASDYRRHVVNNHYNEENFSNSTSKVLQDRQEALRTIYT